MIQIITFYRFTELDELENKRDALRMLMREFGVKGTVILADEGYNATICGAEGEIAKFLRSAEIILGHVIEPKSSRHEAMPFKRIDVKIKPEIVTLKQRVDIAKGEGTHVDPERWNEIISDPETVVLDARNHYEVMNGSFANAVDPNTRKFSELPAFIEKNFDPGRHKRIAMYCTGGIRCEKFAPYLKAKGFENVFQLRGGILKYLETVPEKDSLWRGECFVFDDRVTVDASLRKGVLPDHSVRSKEKPE